MRSLLIAVMGGCIALPAAAHDFWLQPQRFWVAPGAPVSVSLLVGHGADRELWDADIARVTSVRAIGPAGTADVRAGFRQGGMGDVTFETPGVHVLALETTQAQSTLPADQFRDYLEEEGLTPAITLRQQAGTVGADGRELYSRRAKALVRVGSGATAQAAHVTTPVGMTLELVPERDPYGVPEGEPMAFGVIYKGRPLAGALVKLTDLSADDEPVSTQRSDADGRVTFDVPRRGEWQMNVVWTEPLSGNAEADFETVFSSLTFGFPETPAS